jgi:hypothetical protein
LKQKTKYNNQFFISVFFVGGQLVRLCKQREVSLRRETGPKTKRREPKIQHFTPLGKQIGMAFFTLGKQQHIQKVFFSFCLVYR